MGESRIDQKVLKRFAGQLRSLVDFGVRARLENLKPLPEALQQKIEHEGKEVVIELATYTWFNRIIALCYMDQHGILPIDERMRGCRIGLFDNLGDKNDCWLGGLELDKLSDTAIALDYSDLDDLSEEQKYEQILIAIANRLAEVIPAIFGASTAELNDLIPCNFLGEGGITAVINALKDSAFAQVETLGWLYQYYNDLNEEKTALATTQVLTPDWVVRFLVDATLGQYLQEVANERDCRSRLEEIRLLDPCSGSGHILVYAFEVLYAEYSKHGYGASRIAELILSKNLYGLEIDERATQITTLLCSMVARKYDPEFFRRGVRLNILTVQSSNRVWFKNFQPQGKAKEELEYLLSAFKNATLYGALIRTRDYDYSELRKAIANEPARRANRIAQRLEPLIRQAELLAKSYTVAVTNPPYLHKYDTLLRSFLQENYSVEKSDLAIAFVRRCADFVRPDGRIGLITMDAWMFQKSAAEFRKWLLQECSIKKVLWLGYGVFSGVMASTVAFVVQKARGQGGLFVRVTGLGSQQKKRIAEQFGRGEVIENEDDSVKFYQAKSADFLALSGNVLAFTLSDELKGVLRSGSKVKDFGDVKQGLSTADNERFLRLWWEVDFRDIKLRAKNNTEAINSGKKWFPHNKGGANRKWYGNNLYVIDWLNDGAEIRKSAKSVIRNEKYFFRPAITWSAVSNGNTSFRFVPRGNTFNAAGPEIFVEDEDLSYYILGLLNSSLMGEVAEAISQGWNKSVGAVANYPIVYQEALKKELVQLVQKCINLAQEEWDESEMSYDFDKHPLCKLGTSRIEIAAEKWKERIIERKQELGRCEKRINLLVREIFQVSEVEKELKDTQESVPSEIIIAKSLLSYFVGWSLGRYSLEKDGVQEPGSAGRFLMASQSESKDDIMKQLERFLTQSFGEEDLEENLSWIAQALGCRYNETVRQRIRRYFQEDFFEDHKKQYCDPVRKTEAKPIYWQITSGPERTFQAIFYLHAYRPELLGELYDKLQEQIETLSQGVDREDTLEIDKRRWQETQELKLWFEDLIQREIWLDLDDGVLANYQKLFNVSLRS